MKLTDARPDVSLPQADKEYIYAEAMKVQKLLVESKALEQKAQNHMLSLDMDIEAYLYFWDLFTSAERAALKRK